MKNGKKRRIGRTPELRFGKDHIDKLLVPLSEII
jgi:hypothetical protein